jgi:cytochrome c5
MLSALRVTQLATLAALVTAAPALAAPDGAALYKRYCGLCHEQGVGGAPRPRDKANWAPRFKGGVEPMVASVIKGKGAMPPRAGTKLTDEELRAAVEYLAAATR